MMYVIRSLFNVLARLFNKHRMGAIGYCPVCRKAIYETFSMHFDRVRHE